MSASSSSSSLSMITGMLEQDSDSSSSAEITTLFIRLIELVNVAGLAQAQRQMAERINDLFDAQTQRRPSSYRFLLCSKTETGQEASIETTRKPKDAMMLQLLHAIELTTDDATRTVLCRLLHGYMSMCTSSVSERRERRLHRLGGLGFVMRSMARLFKQGLHTHTQSLDVLASLILLLSSKDGRFAFKMRLAGLVSALHQHVFLGAGLCSAVILELLCKCVRSPRNAQLLGRCRGFASQLVSRLDAVTTGQFTHTEAARFTQILYCVSKNNKCKSLLLNEMVVVVLKRMLDMQLQSIADSTCIEMCLVVLASLKQLSRMKKGREQLVSTDTLELCERALQAIDKVAKQSPTSMLLQQMEDSICGLCMRCVPLVPLVVCQNPLPVYFELPLARQTGSTTPSSDEEGVLIEEDRLMGLDGGDCEKSMKATRPKAYSTQTSSQLKRNYATLCDEFDRNTCLMTTKQPHTYQDVIASQVQETTSVMRFVKVAYPDWAGFDTDTAMWQPMKHCEHALRAMTQQAINRHRCASFPTKVVYDLDSLLTDEETTSKRPPLNNTDTNRLGMLHPDTSHLLFESRFESGNLRTATQVGEYAYELVLCPDMNQTRSHYQWFYFQVSNNLAAVPYTFEVVNCIKSTSMFSHGMQPVVFSVSEAISGRSAWVRNGDCVCYYRNAYVNPPDKRKKKHTSYYSVQFALSFDHKADVCYIAYHFPYTYSFLRASLECLMSNKGMYVNASSLCHSLAGNPVPVLTVTGSGSGLAQRQVVIIVGRVHPGESNASWVMHGVIEFLLGTSCQAAQLRDKLVFKLIPMLNPDGVVNGSHRCSLAGVDLNRTWHDPSPLMHPVVFHTKGLVQYLTESLNKRPLAYIDIHGHSRRFNVFMFGNDPQQSWRIEDHCGGEEQLMELPRLLDQTSKPFSLRDCRFNITRAKETSARVVLWRQFALPTVYTMETSYCGFDQGEYQGYQMNIPHLKEMGRDLCCALLKMEH